MHVDSVRHLAWHFMLSQKAKDTTFHGHIPAEHPIDYFCFATDHGKERDGHKHELLQTTRHHDPYKCMVAWTYCYTFAHHSLAGTHEVDGDGAWVLMMAPIRDGAWVLASVLGGPQLLRPAGEYALPRLLCICFTHIVLVCPPPPPHTHTFACTQTRMQVFHLPASLTKWLDPAVHTAAVKAAQAATGRAFVAVTHLGCKTAPVRDAIETGMDTQAQKQSGNWTPGVFESRYCPLLPVRHIVHPAGFSYLVSYFIPRGDLMPSMLTARGCAAITGAVPGACSICNTSNPPKCVQLQRNGNTLLGTKPSMPTLLYHACMRRGVTMCPALQPRKLLTPSTRQRTRWMSCKLATQHSGTGNSVTCPLRRY